MKAFNKYGFDKKETLTNLIDAHGMVKTKDGLAKNGEIVFINPKGGNKARLIATWEFFKSLRVKTLAEYAGFLGAELKPTCLADMPIIRIKNNKNPENFFGAFGSVLEWIVIKDPSGGVNKSGEWTAKLMEENGKLTIATNSI